MEGVSVFFDTNVLVYAHDELSPFHENSALLLDLALKKEITGIISEQNICNGTLPDSDQCNSHDW
jgi:predicted nucleic acid-binding protein